MIDSNTALMILLIVYLLLHGAIYCWYRSRAPWRQDHPVTPGAGGPHSRPVNGQRRRAGVGIHRPEGRSRAVILAAMLVAAFILAGVALWSVTGQIPGR